MVLNGKGIFKFKTDGNKNFNFRAQFCLGGICNGFSSTESREMSLKGNVQDLLIDYNSTDKSGIFNIYMYLITTNNIK